MKDANDLVIDQNKPKAEELPARFTTPLSGFYFELRDGVADARNLVPFMPFSAFEEYMLARLGRCRECLISTALYFERMKSDKNYARPLCKLCAYKLSAKSYNMLFKRVGSKTRILSRRKK